MKKAKAKNNYIYK